MCQISQYRVARVEYSKPFVIVKGTSNLIVACRVVAKMGKYSKFGSYLSNVATSDVSLSFPEIEAILRFPLPSSAREHRPWWANDASHVQARDGWLDIGWKVGSVDLAKGHVTFFRIGATKRTDHTMSKRHAHMAGSSSKQFEEFARQVLSKQFGAALDPATLRGIPKLFDYVSPDREVVGDAKFLTLVRGRSLPPAKFSNIAEHVWLLQKSEAKRRFLVFGNDKTVPIRWLQKYGHLVNDVEFYFLGNEGKLEMLNSPAQNCR